MNIFLLYCSWHERTIYRASGGKLILCGHGKGRRDLSAEHSKGRSKSAEHSTRITVGDGGPARGQARELWRVVVAENSQVVARRDRDLRGCLRGQTHPSPARDHTRTLTVTARRQCGYDGDYVTPGRGPGGPSQH